MSTLGYSSEYEQRHMTDEERAEAYASSLRHERVGVEGKIRLVDAALGKLGKTKADAANAETLKRQRRHHERRLASIDAELARVGE